MKTLTKLQAVFLVLIGVSAIAAETPLATFPIWGGTDFTPVGYYNTIKNLPGQEFVGYTFKCIDGGEVLMMHLY